MEVTVAQMKQIEHDADAAGLSYTQMMENAGQAAAKELLEKKDFRTAAVFCGTGNNGGDGFVLARALHEAGKEVRIVLVGGNPKTSDAILNWEKAQALSIPIKPLDDLTEEDKTWILNADTVVDALYGTGFHGGLRPAGRAACDLINQSHGFCLALDLPSGLNADTGVAAKGTVLADLTVTFHASKPCHRINPAQCGDTEIVSIGVEAVLYRPLIPFSIMKTSQASRFSRLPGRFYRYIRIRYQLSGFTVILYRHTASLPEYRPPFSYTCSSPSSTNPFLRTSSVSSISAKWAS